MARCTASANPTDRGEIGVACPASVPKSSKIQRGAGDWCSAGLLHHLLRSPSAERFAETNIERAIQFGQALAAASVSFRGPQGALSQMEMRFLSRMARAAMHSGRVRVPEFPGKLARAMSLSTVPQAVCATCLSPQQSDDC